AAPCRSVLAGLGGLGIPVGDDFGPAAVGGTAVDESARRLDRSQVHGPALGFGSQHAGDLQDRQLRDRVRDPPVDVGVDGLVDVDPAEECSCFLLAAFGPVCIGYVVVVAASAGTPTTYAPDRRPGWDASGHAPGRW